MWGARGSGVKCSCDPDKMTMTEWLALLIDFVTYSLKMTSCEVYYFTVSSTWVQVGRWAFLGHAHPHDLGPIW